MERKGRSLLWMLTASFFLAAVVLFVLFRFVVTPPAKADAAANAMYTIGEWRGQVAVFEGKQSYPKQVLDMPVSGLPPEVREQLRQGIPAYSEAELSVLLEDYTG